MPATVRTAKKLVLGREIEHMIKTAKVDQATAARMIEQSASKMGQLINGGGQITVGDLEKLARSLGFTDEGYLEALRELRRDNTKRGFWSMGHNRAYSEDLRLLIDLEANADRVRWAEVEVVPGILQTEGYVRALHADASPREGLTTEDRVVARLARQRVLDKDDPPNLHVVMSESCLRRQWGEHDVMRDQREHLVEVSQRPNVMIQIMPFDAPPGRRTPVSSRFILIRVPSPGAAGPLEVATSENPGEFRYMDDAKALAAHDDAWSRLTVAALGFSETRDFIRRMER